MENVVALSRPAAPSAPGQTPTIEIRLNPVRLICWLPVTVCVCPATTTVAEPAQVPANRSAYSASSFGCCSCVESLLPPHAFIIAASATAAANVGLIIVFPSPTPVRRFAAFVYHGIRRLQSGLANSPGAEGRRSLPETSHVPQLYGLVAAHQIGQLRDLGGSLVARQRE